MSVGYSLEEFLQDQGNKNTLSKLQRDVWLLKKFSVSKNKRGELKNIGARDLDVLIANSLLRFRKKDGEQ